LRRRVLARHEQRIAHRSRMSIRHLREQREGRLRVVHRAEVEHAACSVGEACVVEAARALQFGERREREAHCRSVGAPQEGRYCS
jgi:hypothetical protein